LKKKRNTRDEQATITVKQASAVRLAMLGITVEWRTQYKLRVKGKRVMREGGRGGRVGGADVKEHSPERARHGVSNWKLPSLVEPLVARQRTATAVAAARGAIGDTAVTAGVHARHAASMVGGVRRQAPAHVQRWFCRGALNAFRAPKLLWCEETVRLGGREGGGGQWGGSGGGGGWGGGVAKKFPQKFL
jgi:hypothetical protein